MPEPEESIQIGGWKLTPDELHTLVVRGADSPFMLAEAIASVLLDQDERAHTVAIPPAERPTATEASPHVAKLLGCVLEIRSWHVQAAPQPLCAYCWKPWPCPTRRITDEVVEGES